MEATQNGQSGVLAVCPVVSEPRQNRGSVTILFLPMEAATALDQTQKQGRVMESPVQWTVAGQSGLSGRNVHVLVVRATEPESEPVTTLQLNMGAGRVRAGQWRSLCAVSDPVLWLETGALGYPGASAVKLVVKACSPGSGCATTLLQHFMGFSVKAQTPKHKCARKDLVLWMESGHPG